MESKFISSIGRLLVIPVTLNSVCLGMLFGVPMVDAMEPAEQIMNIAVTGNHTMMIVEIQDHEEQPKDVTVQMEHGTEATTPEYGKTSVGFMITDFPHKIFPWQMTHLETTGTPSTYQLPHQQFSLTGTTIKRE